MQMGKQTGLVLLNARAGLFLCMEHPVSDALRHPSVELDVLEIILLNCAVPVTKLYHSETLLSINA